MVCIRCQATNGKAHSFEKIGSLKDNKTNLYYTCPALAEEQDDSPEGLTYYLAHFEATKPNPWIWIFDCKGMKSKDLIKSGLGKRMAEVVQQTYFDTLLGIYILNPTFGIKALIAFINPFLKKETKAKIHVCSLGPIDMINRLESIGVQRNDLLTITKKISN